MPNYLANKENTIQGQLKNSVTVFTNSFLCREIRRHFASVRDKRQNILSVEVTCGHDLLHGLFNNNSVTTV